VAVTLFVFDLLAVDGESTTRLPLSNAAAGSKNST